MPSSRFPQRDLTHRTGGPAVNAASDGLEGAYSATLHTAPSGGVCKVIVPALSLTDYRSAFCSQAFTGSPGDMVLVTFDENKEPWIVSPTGVLLPTTLPPSGSAGGDLSGTYPNPTVAKSSATTFIASGGARVQGQNQPATGAGLELGYTTDTGWVQAYDRSAAAYKSLQLLGTNVQIFPESGGQIILEGFTVCTDRYAGNIGASADGFQCVELNGHTLYWAYNGQIVGYIDGTAITAYSDARGKVNVESAQSGIETVKQLRPVTFEWGPKLLKLGQPEGRHHGFIAQEVQQVVPEAVFENSPETTGVPDMEPHLALNERPLTSIAIQAIKELTARVEALEAELQSIKTASNP